MSASLFIFLILKINLNIFLILNDKNLQCIKIFLILPFQTSISGVTLKHTAPVVAAKILVAVSFLCLPFFSTAQVNLVPNPSFEDTIACPHYANQLGNAAFWWPSRESPDYFHECDWITGQTAIPQNFCGYQYAQEGMAYAGFITFSKTAPNAREFISCELTTPLIIGKKYLVEYYLNNSGGPTQRIASNKIGVMFSTLYYDFNNPLPVNNFAHLYTDSIINDTINWVKFKYEFVSDSTYLYLNIGNFFDDALTDTLMYSPFTSHAYYYIDNISIFEDTTTSINDETLNEDFNVYYDFNTNTVELNRAIWGRIEIFDIKGRLIIDKRIDGEKRFKLPDLISSSIYIGRIGTNSNETNHFKLFKP